MSDKNWHLQYYYKNIIRMRLLQRYYYHKHKHNPNYSHYLGNRREIQRKRKERPKNGYIYKLEIIKGEFIIDF